ncbi:hypothetical protein ACH5RR_010858 [Cinchona calisaya]|uniref:Transmembrane protein n=1 Tax=Cinchona calisaya TaxID=153742 RepID=A0ABD3AK65_9GENT
MGLNSETFQKLIVNGGGSWREPFQILTTLLLSLLLPLSFLLLSRISAAHYLASILLPDNSEPSTFLAFLFLYSSNSTIFLYALVSLVSVAAFVHAFTGDKTTTFLSRRQQPVFRPRLYAAWILLCTLQVCVGLGIEGSIDAGINGSAVGLSRREMRSSLFSTRLIFFFVGLHETTRFWSKSVVKPVVDDTVTGFVKEERWIERVGMALCFGTLWWWGLRDEVDSLAVVAELKKEALLSVGVADFLGWCLYYLTVSIGITRVFKGAIWVGTVLLFRIKVERDLNDSVSPDRTTIVEDKV